MGWGIGIAFQYFHAYHGNQVNNTQKEYERLKENRNNNINIIKIVHMEPKDEMLWAIAKKRAAFRKQLVRYVLVNCFLWSNMVMSGRRSTILQHFPGV